MKKFLLLVICVVAVIGVANAQGKYAKSPDYVQVAKGTWSLGVSGMVFNRNEVTFQTGLYTKYFATDNVALRANVRFGRDWAKGENPQHIVDENNDYDEDYDDWSSRAESDEPEESTTIRSSNFMLVVGAEHRFKLSNRFFGYYGADLGVGGYGQVVRYKIDGELESQAQTNRSVDLTLQPFIGFECFLGPRISLAAEFGYDVLFKFYQKDTYKENTERRGIQTEKYPQYNNIASHIDFGNCTFAALKLAYFF